MPDLAKRVRYALEAAGVAALAAAVPRLSRRGALALSRVLAALSYALAVTPRRIARANLDLAFGDTKTEAEKRRLLRAAFANFLRVGVDQFWMPRLTGQNWRDWVEVSAEDEAFMHGVLARGKGVVAVTLHWGNWEWLGLASGFAGFPLSIIVEPLQNPALDARFHRLRGASGNQLIEQRGGALRAWRALRAGRVLAAVMDTNVSLRRGGIWVEFFGRPVCATPAIAVLSLRTGAPIVGGLCEPLADGRYRMCYGPEISIRPSGDGEADRRALTQAIMNWAEQVVRERPAHWLWMYKRWNYRPGDKGEDFPFYSRPAAARMLQDE